MSDSKEQYIPNSICPLCGDKFFCGCLANTPSKCWCIKYPSIDLNLPFSDKCICELCLKKKIEESKDKL